MWLQENAVFPCQALAFLAVAHIAVGVTVPPVTEAGFGADIGMEKFFNIKCRASGELQWIMFSLIPTQ